MKYTVTERWREMSHTGTDVTPSSMPTAYFYALSEIDLELGGSRGPGQLGRAVALSYLK